MVADDAGQRYSGGLLSLLVFIAAVALLFTGRYPVTLFDLVVGLNRWFYRVVAYAALSRRSASRWRTSARTRPSVVHRHHDVAAGAISASASVPAPRARISAT